MTTPVTLTEMLRRLLWADGQGRAAKTVEIYGWVVLIEGATCMIWPQLVATVLGIPPLEGQGVGYFRLARPALLRDDDSHASLPWCRS